MGLPSLANCSLSGTGVRERSISSEFRETVNMLILSAKYPFALPFPEYNWYFRGRRALGFAWLGNRSDIGSRAILELVTRTQNSSPEEYS